MSEGKQIFKIIDPFLSPVTVKLGIRARKGEVHFEEFFGPEMPYRCVRQISATVINQLLKQDLRITENPDKVDQKQID